MTTDSIATATKTSYTCIVRQRKKIVFLIPYPIKEAPSQRFRFEQYFQLLQSNLFDFTIHSFLTATNWRVFYGRGKGMKKASALLLGFLRRIAGLIAAMRADFIFIHREAAPIGPPVIEWFIAKILRKRIIYDFDDAIWLTDRAQESLISSFIKWRSKISTICALSYRVSCGNQYLCDFARRYASEVVLNPTTIDTGYLHNPELHPRALTNRDDIVIGWTGSHSTLKYLYTISSTLQQIEGAYPNVRFVVIADKAPDLGLNRLTFVPWRSETEIADLMTLDIGIMPLPDDEWSRGKCGFKVLQYMSLGIPSVSSPVGVNTEIVKHGQNGFLSATAEEWSDCLKKLIDSPALRKKVGNAGRETVISCYSVNSNARTFLSLFE